jgi:hypothetical protein
VPQQHSHLAWPAGARSLALLVDTGRIEAPARLPPAARLTRSQLRQAWRWVSVWEAISLYIATITPRSRRIVRRSCETKVCAMSGLRL